METIDLNSLKTVTFAKLDKDEQRARLFAAAAFNKGLELATSPVDGQAVAFALATTELAGKWASKVKKLSFADLFRDPFKGLRDETRAFAKTWNMDTILIAALG